MYNSPKLASLLTMQLNGAGRIAKAGQKIRSRQTSQSAMVYQTSQLVVFYLQFYSGNISLCVFMLKNAISYATLALVFNLGMQCARDLMSTHKMLISCIVTQCWRKDFYVSRRKEKVTSFFYLL